MSLYLFAFYENVFRETLRRHAIHRNNTLWLETSGCFNTWQLLMLMLTLMIKLQLSTKSQYCYMRIANWVRYCLWTLIILYDYCFTYDILFDYYFIHYCIVFVVRGNWTFIHTIYYLLYLLINWWKEFVLYFFYYLQATSFKL